MARRRALPEGLDPRVRSLVHELQRLRDRAELSVTRLAAKTSFSKASWERYLSGRALPPRQAVEEFARACGADPVRLMARREVAADAWAAARARRAAGPEEPEGRAGSGDGAG
ncbi:helix-turn-helix domain-containing protein, partial [Streptomyces fuscigenes]|uniref:helix-turn-helix domain-containing protein n=1 Tax=Streptomyces fuscigenes TaxID=1528880 RepID=UPI001F38940F